jgi:hypothetical protein
LEPISSFSILTFLAFLFFLIPHILKFELFSGNQILEKAFDMRDHTYEDFSDFKIGFAYLPSLHRF